MIAIVDANNTGIQYRIGTGGYAVDSVRPHKHLHVIVVERVLGRELRGDECFHHVNENRLDNRRCNLVLCPNQAYHMRLHARTRLVNRGGIPGKHSWCSWCEKLKTVSEFRNYTKARNGKAPHCKSCADEYRSDYPQYERKAA